METYLQSVKSNFMFHHQTEITQLDKWTIKSSGVEAEIS